MLHQVHPVHSVQSVHQGPQITQTNADKERVAPAPRRMASSGPPGAAGGSLLPTIREDEPVGKQVAVDGLTNRI